MNGLLDIIMKNRSRQPMTLQMSSVDRQGYPIDLSRPFVSLADGGVGTEYQATEQMPDGTFVNFPTIWGGAELPIDEAFARFMQARSGGQRFPTFNTQDEAVAAAIDRSRRIAELRGMGSPVRGLLTGQY